MIKFCSLFSGSSGNAIFLGSDKTKLLIDAGLSAKKIIEALCSIGENPAGLSAILVTHEHSDHIKGVGILSRKFDLPIYANPATWRHMEALIGPVSPANMKFFETGEEFDIGDVCIRPFSTPHDAADPVGFNFFVGNKKITTVTDIGHVTRTLLEYIEGSHLLLLESNHDIEMLKVGRYPWYLKRRIMSDLGHLSNDMAGKTIAYLAGKGTRNFLIGHLSKENNFPDLAYQTVCNELHAKGICAGKDVMLEVALRDRVGSVIEMKV